MRFVGIGTAVVFLGTLASCATEDVSGSSYGLGTECMPDDVPIYATVGHDPPVTGAIVGDLALGNSASALIADVSSSGGGITGIEIYAGTYPGPLVWNPADGGFTQFNRAVFPVQYRSPA